MATATAASVLMTVGALAGSNNTLDLSQSGNGNIANVGQGNASDSNVGSGATPATQSGSNNRLDFVVGASTNSGNGDNDIGQFYQLGNTNLFSGAAAGTGAGGAGTAHNNRLNYFNQSGNGNGAYVTWTGSSSSTVDNVQMLGNLNTLTILQSQWATPGTNNYVGNAWIIGDHNGTTGGNGWLHGAADSGIFISQVGSWNKVTQSVIVGSNNNFTYNAADPSKGGVHEIRQTGNYNGLTASSATTYGSNGNHIKVTETGDWNNFSVSQGVTSASTQNFAKLVQTGNGNNSTISEYGSYNTVNASQIGDSNASSTLISGDHNGNGAFTNGGLDFGGTKGALQVANANGLASGDVKQLGNNNLTNFTITGNSTQFASLQNGNSNAINATIGGNFNQAAVAQNGSWNNATFTQSGSNNMTAVSQ